jgi:D-alanyl-D-alanine dipeptidase
MIKILFIIIGLLTTIPASLPEGFEYVKVKIPNIELDIKYYGEDNFVGEVIDAYLAPRAILTTKATSALTRVQKELSSFSLGLKIFDAYRPQRAVDHFV